MTRSFQQVTSFLGGEVSPRLRGRVGTERYRDGSETIENFIVHAQGGAERRPGAQDIGLIGEESIAITLRQESNDLTVIVSQARIEIFDGATTLGIIATSPYANVDLDELYWSQDEQSLEIVCDAVRPHQVKLVDGLWTFGPSPYESIPQYLFADSQSPAGIDAQTTITLGGTFVIGDSFTLEYDGFETATIAWTDDTAILRSRIKSALAPFIYDYAGNVNLNSFAVSGDGPFVVTRIGVATIIPSLIRAGSTTSALGTVSVSYGTPTTSTSGATEDAWSDDRGWPRTVAYHDQRKIYGGTRSLPATLWGSRVGFESDFRIGQDDDDAFSFRLKSQKPMAIKWMSSKRLLALGTTGGDIVQFARPLTPTSVQFDRQTGHQSASILPVEANSETFYVLRGGRKLYTLLYEFEAQGWRSIDLTFPSEHITEGIIRQVDYSDQPDGIVWCVLRNGEVAAMTYERTQGVIAWHRHSLPGNVRSVAVVHRNDVDQVWFVVEESGQWRVCRLRATSTSTPETDGWLDYWIKSVGKFPTKKFTGLENLAGRSVRVIADGMDFGYRTIVGGEVELTDKASEVYVGLDYTATIRTNAYDGGSFGTSQPTKRRWSNLIARLVKSVMPMINGYRPPDRSGDTVMDQAEPLFTGDTPVEGTEYDDGSIEIIADLPGPCHVTGLFGVLSAGQG